ncbi:hypothetical protein Dsin_021749 [Dipteronia sinensis]|uniref:Exonuclease domain-containing protein n=1 Tax=Dipteronia sinensis TaxID=43782 RepID=A0AAE0A0C1_9ROSI|nr:hypothetical protein Dsin_021749 [Dipteronia sinensis]
MRAVPMCSSILQIQRYGIRSLANFYNESFHKLGVSYDYRSNYRLLCSKTNGVEGGYSKRWTRRSISTNTGQNKTTQSSKSILVDSLSQEQVILREKVISEEHPSDQCCDIHEWIAQNKDLTDIVTVIVFDIETTGFARKFDRIIEIALKDLSGGENSTFSTLVNPERFVPNTYIHGISTNMVCRPDVPRSLTVSSFDTEIGLECLSSFDIEIGLESILRMVDLIPILLQYVKSRQKPGGYVMLVAHNSRNFDVPFLIEEFARHSYEVPPSWLFVDTLALAQEIKKSEGSQVPPGRKLEVLREHFGIPLVGPAHRAMSDVNTLSLIFQRLTFDLKVPLSGLVERSFTALALINAKKNPTTKTTKKKKSS